ncbi:MAG: hypothetical protein ACRYFZ_19550 [Janthinobacterium lividum]
MFVERVLSLNNGWSILTTQKSEEWAEAQAALNLINDGFILTGLVAAIEAEEEAKKVASDTGAIRSFLPYYIYNIYNSLLETQFKWVDKLPTAKSSVRSQIAPKAVKNKVSVSTIEADAMQTEDFLTSLYITIPYYHNTGSIDVTVLLIPTASAIAHILELGAKPAHIDKLPTEEICREQLAKFGTSNSKAPVVLAFFSPTAPEEVAVEETTPLKIGGHTIERTIEFAPEHYQAGVGLLSYFGQVLRQKDPGTKAKVRLEQEGNTVRLRIESPSGDIETIEEELEKYALVISNKAEPESLFENRAYVMQLEHKLDVTKLELKQAYNTIALTDGLHSQRINNLEQQVTFLKDQVAAQLLQTNKVIELVGRQNDSHERMHTALLTHSGMLFKDLLQEASGNQQLLEAVSSLHQNLLVGITTIEIEDQLERALSTIKETKPGFLGRILSELQGAAYKASASSALSWVTTWIATHAQ